MSGRPIVADTNWRWNTEKADPVSEMELTIVEDRTMTRPRAMSIIPVPRIR